MSITTASDLFRKFKGKKLLNFLLILVAVPVVVLLVRSTLIMTTQRGRIVEISGRYVLSLAQYGAARFDEGDAERMGNFLELLLDRGYERVYERIFGEDELSESEGPSGKFIPGFLAYFKRDGTFIVGSSRSEVLTPLWQKHSQLREAVLDNIEVKNGGTREEMAYNFCIWPTKNPDVLAVAAVTLASWGLGGSPMSRFVTETMLAALFCLAALLLLRKALIHPLRALSLSLRTFELGRETPKIDLEEGRLFGMQVEEVASLRSAIIELTQKAVEKTELEKRYVGDIVKTQEDERNRLAREIHDGPIQIVAALIQRIQMASMGEGEGIHKQLALAEEAAQYAVEELRGVCDSLVPPWVSLGLARCLEETGARLARQHDVVIDVDIDLDIDLIADFPQNLTLALFRIFQEGVSNAVRHGHAAHINLSVLSVPSVARGGRSDLLFVLRDDGAGFDLGSVNMDKLYVSGRRGLVGMRQRVESFDGTFTIVSAPGNGTTIEVRLRTKGNGYEKI